MATKALKISRPRIMRSTHDQPLTMTQIKAVAPAVFQEAPAPYVSDNYAYIPTIQILNMMLKEGFTIHEVAQARPYLKDNDPYMKHMVRMRMPVRAKRVGEIVPEIVLINAHNGTARYYLFGGVYRFLCSNGAIAGDTIASLTVAHRGGELTSNMVLEGSYKIVQDEFPKLITAYNAMRAKTLKPKQQLELAATALELRYASGAPTFKAEQLLDVRRVEDQEPTLWNVFNRIQENVLEGGMKSVSFLYARQTTVKRIEQVDQRVKINRGLWDAAMAYI